MNNKIKTFALMIDCSRNAVYSVPFIKKLIPLLAKMRYTALMLYTEDTYEMEKYPYFAKGVIPANMYEGVDHDTQTVGVKAVLVASKNQSDESVKAVVKAILNNFDEYKKLHPALGLVTKESLVEGLSAPLHPAAEAIFKEAGILK